MANSAVMSAVREQACAIYCNWDNGNIATATAMLNQIPHNRIAYAVFTMSVLAIRENKQYLFSKFIEGTTQ